VAFIVVRTNVQHVANYIIRLMLSIGSILICYNSCSRSNCLYSRWWW